MMPLVAVAVLLVASFFSITVRIKLNYKRLKDIEEIILLRQTKKTKKKEEMGKVSLFDALRPSSMKKNKKQIPFQSFHFRLSPFSSFVYPLDFKT